MIAPPRPPSHDEFEALIREARARQLRRRLLGAAAVAIASALGLSIYALLAGGNLSSVTPANAGQAGAPSCRSAQLTAVAGLNGATGTMLGPVLLTNTSDGACTLPAERPSVRILWQGRVLPVRNIGGMDDAAPPLRVLGPHSTATIFMDWSNWCGKPSEGTVIRPTFELRWSGGLGVNALNNQLTPPRCNSPAGGSLIAVSVPERD